MDLIPAPQPANLKRLATALKALDAQVLNPGQEDVEIDAKMLLQATIWQFATRDGGIEVPVVDLDDLIQMKLARGRPVDLADVAALTDEGPDSPIE